MLAFLRFLRGYYKLHVSGYSPERFMNLCRLNGVILWDIIPEGEYYSCKIILSDFPLISPFLQKTKVKADIQKEYGLPFFMRKNRKRKIFFAGVVISFLFIYGMSFFIWSFRFTGNEMIHNDILLRFVNSLGVEYGTYKTGTRAAGISFSLQTFVAKLKNGIIGSVVLTVIILSSSPPMPPSSPSTPCLWFGFQEVSRKAGDCWVCREKLGSSCPPSHHPPPPHCPPF